MPITRRRLLPNLALLTPAALVSRAVAVSAAQPLFLQPSYPDGIGAHFSVTGAAPPYNPVDAFYLHANQPNPYRTDHAFVPVAWPVGDLTGFPVTGDARLYQYGTITPNDATGYGHTAAQMQDDTVGAYLRSADLFAGSPGNRMMIAPLYTFAAPPAPFSRSGGSLRVSLDLQVPTASDFHIPNISNTYTKIDLLFVCAPTGARLSVSCGLFVNNGNPTLEKIGYDPLTFTIIMFAQAQTVSRRITLLPGSSTLQSQKWLGWKHFDFTLSNPQFAGGLGDALSVARAYGYTLSTNPADYVLSALHLNAELHYTESTPATLGWSMRGLSVTQTD